MWLVVEVSRPARPTARPSCRSMHKRGVREAWLVDLEQERVEVYRGRTDEGYGAAKRCAPGDVIAPEVFPEARLAVAEILR